MMKSIFLACSVLFAGSLFAEAEEKLKVFILAGQSNMEGKAKVSLMETQAVREDTAALYIHLRDGDGEWKVRDDVWIRFLNRSGSLTVGFGSPDRVGPELEFGNVIGDHFEEPVLLIKTAWGGKSLYRDFRPPSSGLPVAEILAAQLERAQKKKPETTLAEIEASYGHYYRLMLQEVDETLKNLGESFPDLAGREPEIAGLVWFQGWNDMVNADYVAEYSEHMVNFIRDVRKDLGSPKLPFVIGQLGVGGKDPSKPNERRDEFKANQAAPASLPEFRDNVAVVETDQYWDTTAQAVFDKGWKQNIEAWEAVGSDYPFHYLGSPKTFLGIGRGFGEAMIELLGK
ncbi:MAG: sialate O-acetylesterase [Verrucomicrobiales bacterium]|nr:sialate O-acetylesterase [Verrucomicrobiales bacterium]